MIEIASIAGEIYKHGVKSDQVAPAHRMQMSGSPDSLPAQEWPQAGSRSKEIVSHITDVQVLATLDPELLASLRFLDPFGNRPLQPGD